MAWKEKDEKCCGTCEFHHLPDRHHEDFWCENSDSDYYDEETPYEEVCFDYEPKE